MFRVISFILLLASVESLSAAPLRLSETGLYSNLLSKTLAPTSLHYVPQYPLWTDGAKKDRWIFLPPNQKVVTGSATSATSPFEGTIDHWLFPVGTKIWKEFAFQTMGNRSEIKRVETRYMEKVTEDEWTFASYLWNNEETEADLVSEEGQAGVYPSSPSTSHDIPSVTACLRCHRRGGDSVLGFDALQLSDDRDPLALHAEKLTEKSLTLRKLLDGAYLSHNAAEFASGNVRVHGRTPNERAVVGYLHANCASCHNSYGSAMHVRMDLRHSLRSSSAATEAALVNTIDKFTLVFNFPGVPKSYRVKSGDPTQSALYQMMVTDGTTHMPPLGAAIQDAKATSLIRRWIEGL